MFRFCGIMVRGEGLVVEDWLSRQFPAVQDEVLNLLVHLEKIPMGKWRWPEYDPLEGEGVISELRADPVPTESGVITCRIYGLRGHPDAQRYTFLHATAKDTKNDVTGKQFAKLRIAQLASGDATVHRFNFPI